MRVYTFIFTVLIPIILMIVLNTLIFKHARSSTRRVQPQMIAATLTDGNSQQPRIRRREMVLLKHILLMSATFTIGWTPAYAVVIFNRYVLTYVTRLIFQYSVILGEIAILIIILHLFISNHEIREYSMNKVRHWLRW